MPRFVALISLAVVLACGTVTAGGHAKALAQEATPSGDVATSPVPTFEVLAFATGMDLASPGELTVLRFRLEPGMALPLTPDDPTGGLFMVESGTLAVEVEVPLLATRGAALEEAIVSLMNGGDFLPEVEESASGELLTLKPGDSVYIPGNLAGEIRNDGPEVAVGLAFLAGPVGVMSEATPAP